MLEAPNVLESGNVADPAYIPMKKFFAEPVDDAEQKMVHALVDIRNAETYPGVLTGEFGDALALLKAGKRVSRTGWNGKGMWLILVLAAQYGLGFDIWMKFRKEAGWSPPDEPTLLPWIGMKTADNKFVPWLASQTDILANDWAEVQ